MISPNLRSTCIDFGRFRTELHHPTHQPLIAPRISDYEPLTSAIAAALTAQHRTQPGDPEKGVQAVIEIVTGEGRAKGKPWPVRGVALGPDAYLAAKEEATATIKNLENWIELSISTDFSPQPNTISNL
jgi:hypothetical protein